MFSSVKDKPALACSCCKQLGKTNKYHRLFQLTAPWKDLTTNTERKAQSHFMPNSKTATATMSSKLQRSHSPGRKSWIEQECMQHIDNNPSHQERSDKLMMMMMMMMCIWLANSWEEEEEEA
jgi:hypothetical protein